MLRLPPGGRVLDYGCADVPYRHFFPPDADFVAADLVGNPDAALELNADASVPAEDDDLRRGALDPGSRARGRPAALPVRVLSGAAARRPLLLSTHGMFAYHPDPEDYWRWTCAGLKRVVEDAGFEVMRFEGIIGLAATGLQLFQDGIYYELPMRLRPVLVFLMRPLILLVEWIPWRRPDDYDAQVFALIAEKPVSA